MGAIRMSALSYREETPLVKVGTGLPNVVGLGKRVIPMRLLLTPRFIEVLEWAV